MKTLLERWRALAGDGADALGQKLLAAYAEPQRRYHDQSHIEWLLDEAERRADQIADAAFVGYAIWFHDGIYQPGMPDNETRSAAWTRAALADKGALAERVAHVIEMTKNHAVGDASGDEALFLDMDVAILGTIFEVYHQYAANIRAEYPHVPDATFAAGRGAFLDGQLANTRIFRTDFYEREFGQQARANMCWEREEMRSGRMVKADAG